MYTTHPNPNGPPGTAVPTHKPIVGTGLRTVRIYHPKPFVGTGLLDGPRVRHAPKAFVGTGLRTVRQYATQPNSNGPPGTAVPTHKPTVGTALPGGPPVRHASKLKRTAGDGGPYVIKKPPVEGGFFIMRGIRMPAGGW